MCGRFTLSRRDEEQIAYELGISVADPENSQPRHNNARLARLFAFLAFPAFWLALVVACAASSSVTTVSIAAIMGQPEAWNGRTVQVSGRLLEFRDSSGAGYGVVEQGDGRIGIRDIEPWRDMVGEDVQANGTVSFDRGFGFYLANVSIRALHGTAPMPQTP